MTSNIKVTLKFYNHQKYGDVVNSITCDKGLVVHNSTIRIKDDFCEREHIQQCIAIARRYRVYKFNYENPLTWLIKNRENKPFTALLYAGLY